MCVDTVVVLARSECVSICVTCLVMLARSYSVLGSLVFCLSNNKFCLKREERKPTRCNNIDDLLSIVDVDY